MYLLLAVMIKDWCICC